MLVSLNLETSRWLIARAEEGAGFCGGPAGRDRCREAVRRKAMLLFSTGGR